MGLGYNIMVVIIVVLFVGLLSVFVKKAVVDKYSVKSQCEGVVLYDHKVNAYFCAKGVTK